MAKSLREYFNQVIRELFTFKKTNRHWHIPVLAALCVGIPLFAGLYFNHLTEGLLASLSGLVILYIPIGSDIPKRMLTLLLCSFGFVFSYTLGLIFSFDPLVSSLVFGLFSGLVYFIHLVLRTKAPGNFFFIMLAAISSCLPHSPELIFEKTALVALGTLTACALAFLYSVFYNTSHTSKQNIIMPAQLHKSKTEYLFESLIMGLFMFCAMQGGHLLQLKNPYWIPISCLAVMQGVTLVHVWQRSIHRVIGTFLGLILCWLILSLLKTPFTICLSIVILQFIVELLIVRNYALAVIFITPMTLLLVEAANPLIHDPNQLFFIRFYDILIGSVLGAIGGWFIYNERLRRHTIRNVRKAKLLLKRKL